MDHELHTALSFVDVGLCWQWTGTVDRDGYGKYRQRGAHRVVWELLVGPVGTGLDLDHLCRNHACVNPDHLEPVTRAENLGRGWRKKQTHCKHGHEFTEENTNVRKNGTRECRECSRSIKRSWRARQRG